MSKFYQDFPCLAKCCLAFFGGDAKSLAWAPTKKAKNPNTKGSTRRVSCLGSILAFFVGGQIPRLGVSCSSGAAQETPKRGIWHCFLHVGCCLSCLGSFVAFFGGDAKSLAWVFLARRVLTKWMVMGSVYLELFETKPCCILVCPIYYPLRAMEHHFVVPKCPNSVKISPV